MKFLVTILMMGLLAAQAFGAAPFGDTDAKLNELKAWLAGIGVVLMTLSIMGGSIIMMYGNENKAFWVKVAIGGTLFGASSAIASFFVG